MDLFTSAENAERAGLIFDWVIDYLHQSGNNDKLAYDLIRQGKYHSEIIDYPIGALDKLLGPDKSFDYFEEPADYEYRVNSMVDNLANGWKPAPFIASKIWSDHFELHDGAHRAEAMRRSGIEHYPTIFFFETKKALDDFMVSVYATKSSNLIH